MRKDQRRSAIKHYLLTLEIFVTGLNFHLHGYVMTKDKRNVMAVAEEMINYAEQKIVKAPMVMLETELSTGVDIVRDIICAASVKGKDRFAGAKEFHKCIFVTALNSSDDVRLMKLH